MGVYGCINGCVIETKTLNVTQDILKFIAEIDEFKGAWRALGLLAPEGLRALRHVATIESVGASTRIEGSKLSDREVAALLSDLQVKRFDSRDEQEVVGYAAVMELVFQSWQDIPLTENHIKQLHGKLLQHSDKDVRHRGEYKKFPNDVVAFDETGKQAGVVFATATPFETPALMAQIIAWTNEALASKTMHPLLVIALFIVVFLEIHPFQDGNGRLSRILTTLLLLRAGYAYAPFSSLESVIEKNKEGYYLALRQTQGTIRGGNPDWQPWVSYFLQTLVRQSRHLAEKIESEKMILSNLPELSLQILTRAQQQGRATMADLLALTGANRNTLKGHFRALVKKGHLSLRGKGRGSWYELS